MSATMPIDQARRLYQAAENTLADPAPFMDQARDELIEKLVAGKNVNRTNCRDIFDCAVDGSYHNVLDLLESVLSLSEKGGDDFQLDARDCANAAKKIIEDFIDSKPEWIWEKACELANDEEDDRE